MLSDYRHEVHEDAKKRLSEIPDDLSGFDAFREGFTTVLGNLTEIAKSDLVDYVVHRATVLAFLDKLLKANDAGRVEPESQLHGVFFPLRRTSDNVDYDDQNLWLVDERLAYHRYLASDTPFAEQAGAPVDVDSNDRPDVVIYNNPHAFVASDPPFSSVVLVEFKKPERADYTQEGKSPIAQVLRYIERIRTGKAKRPDGTLIERPASVPFYCYIIATMTPALEKDARERGFVETPDAMGWFHFNQNYNAYVEVLSYRRVLGDAQKRNAAFFDKLNIRPRS